MEPKIKTYINKLTTSYPEINSIWLIGSRANNYANKNSDWDFLVFANEHIIKSLKNNLDFKRENIDLLIVYNGNDFKEPWGDNPKKGSLKEWRWKLLSDSSAHYTENKFVINENDTAKFSIKYNLDMGDYKRSRKKAIRMWP